VAHSIRLYFASDLHGSEKCFRKFLNGATAYGADVLILGGDIGGKALQPIVNAGDEYVTTFRGTEHRAVTDEELRALERMIADYGYYGYRAEPGEMEARQQEGSLEALFTDLMKRRLEEWVALADERLRPREIPVFWMLGNDDPPELAEILDRAPWGENAEGKVLQIEDHELVSYGYSNRTPWDSYRELDEDELGPRLEEMTSRLQRPEGAIFNLHVPPYDSGLDQAPQLNADLRVQQSLGQVKFGPVGSTAVRRAIEQAGPLLSLHGHVHESAGFSKIGRTLAVNPGSDYGTGALNGAIIRLERDKVKSHQLVRG
jgi:Icc-related predicted phosphoesterase